MDGTIIYDEIIETSLLRNGMKNNGTFGIIDDLSISYDGNRLLSVTDDADPVNYNGALDFNDGTDLSVEYEYNSIGALVRDSNRGINNIIYDYCSYPQIISMGYGQREICYDYTPDGRKLYSRHTTRIAGVSSNTMNTITDTYIDGLILRDGSPLMWQFDGGYVALNASAAPTSWNYYISDHLGSTRMVVTSTNTIKETINYYPYGSEMRMTDPAQMTNTSNKERFRFSGKELDFQNGLNMYDFGARMFDVAGVPIWTSVDPLCEKYYDVSPYAYCLNNPMNAIDPDGCDTLNISFNQGKWIFSDPIIAKGDDIFIVTVDGATNTYTFSEGEYGDRVDALNLESNEDYTLGVYHISGVSSQGTGYYVTPGGPPSTRNGSKARIPEGIYPIIEGRGTKWKKAGVGGSVEGRGIRFHYEVSRDHNPRKSTEGCFVLSYDYIPNKEGTITYNQNESISASRNFDIFVGGAYPYINKNNGREATKFLNPITAILSLKSIKK